MTGIGRDDGARTCFAATRARGFETRKWNGKKKLKTSKNPLERVKIKRTNGRKRFFENQNKKKKNNFFLTPGGEEGDQKAYERLTVSKRNDSGDSVRCYLLCCGHNVLPPPAGRSAPRGKQ